jgi:hypothetical protein
VIEDGEQVDYVLEHPDECKEPEYETEEEAYEAWVNKTTYQCDMAYVHEGEHLCKDGKETKWTVPWQRTYPDGAYRVGISYWFEGYSYSDWESGAYEYDYDYGWKTVGRPRKVSYVKDRFGKWQEQEDPDWWRRSRPGDEVSYPPHLQGDP